MGCCCVQRVEGVTDAALPRAAAVLAGMPDERKEDLFKVLELLSGQNPGRFEADLDYVCVALVPSTLDACLRYYAGKGPKLAEQLNAATLRRLDALVCQALRLA